MGVVDGATSVGCHIIERMFESGRADGVSDGVCAERPVEGVAPVAPVQIVQITAELWRVSGPAGVLGWVRWVPSRAGFHFRAQRRGPRGPAASLGEYLALSEAASALRLG